MKVLKFGGSSVATAERMTLVTEIVKGKLRKDKRLVVVVSAMGGVTDMLIDSSVMAQQGKKGYLKKVDEMFDRHKEAVLELCGEKGLKRLLPKLQEKTDNLKNLMQGVFLVRELSPRVQDCIVSYGELMSSIIIADFMNQSGLECRWLDSRQVLRTNSDFGAAKVDFKVTNANIKKLVKSKTKLMLMGGFIASNDEGVTTTLGRGGSDYTAAIMASGVEAKELEIWTDVNGVLTADPRKVSKAFTLDSMTYEEALEMSHFGAKVIHPPTIQPVLQKDIPLRICNTFQPEFPGTSIRAKSDNKHIIKGVSSLSQIALVTVQGSGMIGVAGVSGRLFSSLATAKVNVILITQASSEHSISFAVKPEDAAKAKAAIEDAFEYELRRGAINEVAIEDKLSVVAIIGSNMKNTTGISGQLFGALAKNGINVRAIAQGSSELNISVVVKNADEKKALNALHETFFLADKLSINLFMIGTGLISKTLLKQIEDQLPRLSSKMNIEIGLTGITNSRKMLIKEEGVSLSDWSSELEEQGKKANLQAFIKQIVKANLANSILIDCTASEAPIGHYAKLLSNSISIVTPNKIANSGKLKDYKNFNRLAKKHGVKFLYETNVGAGLPVITTLNDLLKSGDEIVKIEAVLSGSLSFIFSSFTKERKFSEVVIEAGDKGFTEPDPREDLSGQDVARKVLILAREMGLQLEPKDVVVENILPKPLIRAKTIPAFFKELPKHDKHFAKLRDKSLKEKKVLRMLASIEDGQTSVALKAVDESNPFYHLSGSDNMIVFTTKRYSNTPLVVKGPGAGAEVTAAGVFAEIISVASYLE